MKPDKSQKKSFSIRKRAGSFTHAIRGIVAALRTEHNLRIHFVAAIVITAAGIYFKISRGEWMALALAIGFVITTELINSAIELLADFISPGHHKDIGKIKDIASGAVLIAAITAVVIGILIFLPYLKIILTKD